MIWLAIVAGLPAVLLWLALELDARKHGPRELARRRRDYRVADELGERAYRRRLTVWRRGDERDHIHVARRRP